MNSESVEEYFRDKTVRAMALISERVAAVSAEKYAPKGWTLQLSRGIRALDPVKKNGQIIGLVISAGTQMENGDSYAFIQHNDKKRHVKEQPVMGYSFMDYGEGETDEERYWDGYRIHGGTEPYATEYLIRGLNDSEVRRDIKTIVERVIK